MDHIPVSSYSLFSQVLTYLSLINLVAGSHQKFDILSHIIDKDRVIIFKVAEYVYVCFLEKFDGTIFFTE